MHSHRSSLAIRWRAHEVPRDFGWCIPLDARYVYSLSCPQGIFKFARAARMQECSCTIRSIVIVKGNWFPSYHWQWMRKIVKSSCICTLKNRQIEQLNAICSFQRVKSLLFLGAIYLLICNTPKLMQLHIYWYKLTAAYIDNTFMLVALQ